MALIAIYWYLAVRDNDIRDEAGIPEGFDHAYEDDLTDRKVGHLLSPWPIRLCRSRLTIFLEPAIPVHNIENWSTSYCGFVHAFLLIWGRACGLEFQIRIITRLGRLITLVLRSLRIFRRKCLIASQYQAFL